AADPAGVHPGRGALDHPVRPAGPDADAVTHLALAAGLVLGRNRHQRILAVAGPGRAVRTGSAGLAGQPGAAATGVAHLLVGDAVTVVVDLVAALLGGDHLGRALALPLAVDALLDAVAAQADPAGS